MAHLTLQLSFDRTRGAAMKVAVGILAVLLCGTHVSGLQCLTCRDTVNEATCISTNCTAPDNTFCKSVYADSGSWINVTKSCESSCIASEPLITCCNDTDNCNAPRLQCYTCTNATDESKCMQNVCRPSAKQCKTSYTITGSNYTVTKTCEDYCTAVSKGTQRDTCCSENNCNIDLLQCYTCTDSSDESSCTALAICGTGDSFCKTIYKSAANGVTVTKGCAANCTAGTKDSERTECCSSDGCNKKALSCLTCDEETDESKCMPNTCADTESWCQSSYSLATGAVTKKCAANCTESKSSVADAQVMCCGVSQCNVDVLQCYSCTNATDVSKCTSVTPCGRGETFCRTLYKTTSSGVTVTKSCAANCTVGTKETERTECCSSDRCNTLQCYTCDNESPVFECPLQTCDGDASFCMSTYNHTSGVVTKACAATCTPSSTAAMEIQCCNSPECNRKRIQCFSCKEITDETKCTSIQVCSTSDNACQSYYNTTTSGTAITKQCVSSCRAQETQSRKTTCCSGIKCNVPILTCYTCTDQTNEAKCNQNTTCKAGENYCITRYDQTSGVRKVTRNCGTSCSHSTSTSTATRCCQSLLCNKATVDAGNSAPSSGPCTFLTLLQPCLLLLLLAFLSPTQ